MSGTADDKRRIERMKASFTLVTERESTLDHMVGCLTQQHYNTLEAQRSPRDRIAKRRRNNHGPYSRALMKADEKDKKNLEWFVEHTKMIESHIITIKAKPEKERKRCIAFAMGYQKRLGAASNVVLLEPELIRMILTMV
jgi:hypothetical protein